MIRENKGKQMKMELVMVENLVPGNHLLRKIDKVIDFSFINEICKPYYCENNGRPAIEPEILFRMLFIGYLYGIRSERRLVEEVQVNVAYRWFLGYDLEDKIPDVSVIWQNRLRRFNGTDIPQQIFDNIVRQAIQDALDILDDTKEPVASDEEKATAVATLEDLLKDENQDANKLYTILFKNGATNAEIKTDKLKKGVLPDCDLPTKADDTYYTYSYAWNTQIVAVTGDATYIAVESKTWNEAKQAIIDDAQDIIDNHSDEFKKDYTDALQDQLDIINSDTATDAQKEAAVDELARLTSDENKNANRATLDEYGPYDEALLKVNNLIDTPVIIPSVKQDIIDRVAVIAATVVDENGDRFLKPGTDDQKQAVIAATAALNAIILELDADNDGQLDDSKKLPADYTEYDQVFAILETLQDNDKITEALHNEIMSHINSPLPRDLKKDKQSIIDNETAAIKNLLDRILEKDGSGNYTSTIKDSALIHYFVTFKWLNGQVSQKVVKGNAAILPAGAPNTPGTIYGVDGKLDGHYIFRGWNQDYSNVTKDMFIDANYDVEAHTDADEDNKCEVCGCTIDTSFKCPMCPFYQKNKDIPVVGWFIIVIHFFVHLAAQIGHWS